MINKLLLRLAFPSRLTDKFANSFFKAQLSK